MTALITESYLSSVHLTAKSEEHFAKMYLEPEWLILQKRKFVQLDILKVKEKAATDIHNSMYITTGQLSKVYDSVQSSKALQASELMQQLTHSTTYWCKAMREKRFLIFPLPLHRPSTVSLQTSFTLIFFFHNDIQIIYSKRIFIYVYIYLFFIYL